MVTVDPPPALFALPGLTWAPDDLRVLKLPLGVDPPALGEWSQLESLQLALLALDPLMRVMELAGYVTSSLQLGAGSPGSPPSSWVMIEPDVMEVYEAPAGVAPTIEWPVGARFAIALHVNVRRTPTERSLAMAGEPFGVMPFSPFWSTDGPNALVFGSTQAVATAGDLLTAIDGSEIPGFVEQCVAGLADRWRDQDPLDPFLAAAGPGLLWIFDPRYWDADPPTWTGADAEHAQGAATTVIRAADADPAVFFRAQVNAATRSDLREATLAGLLEIATEDPATGRNLKRDVFAALENRFVWAIEQGLGGSLDEGTFHDVCGQAWLGHPSRLRWMDVVLYLAESRLLPFPALVHPELDYAFEPEVDPVEVVLTVDGLGVLIRIFGSDPIVVYREIDIGFPPERCFTWEYTGADEQGIATLIVVAAPGVSVTGRENVASSWRLVVYRVQDHDLVPAWGEHIQTALLEAPFDEGPLMLSDLGLFVDGDAVEEVWELGPRPADAPAPEPAFRIWPLPLGMRIAYPAAAGPDDVEFSIDITVDEDAWDQRFTYWIEPLPPVVDPEPTHMQRYDVIVRATWGVGISVRYSAAAAWIFEHYQRGDHLASVDPPGVPVSADLAEMALRGVARVGVGDVAFERLPTEGYMWALTFAQLGADVGIGMIPIVGDAVDLAEFILSFESGTDKWGNPVSNVDRAVMLGGVLMPFVSSGALRGVKAALGG